MKLSAEKWLIRLNEYDSAENLKNETNFTLTNGYMGVRGAFEECSRYSLPGNYIAGVFNQGEASERALVNAPNWLGIKLYVADAPLDLDECKVTEFSRVLDMKQAAIYKRYIIEDKAGRRTQVEGFRYVSRSNVHRAGIRMTVLPLNYSELVTVESDIDGTVTNRKDNAWVTVKHLKMESNTDFGGKGCYMEMATRDEDTRIGIGAITKISDVGGKKKHMTLGERSVDVFKFPASEGRSFTIEKFVITYTSRDVAKKDVPACVSEVADKFMNDGIDSEFVASCAVYDKLWSAADIEIAGDAEADTALRFNVFHLMSTANEHDSRVSIAAKGLHGEGYWGHVFWDTEIFMLPFFMLSNPDTARTLIKYRYITLNAAREHAAKNGRKGAQYPWQSADIGRSESNQWTEINLNIVRIWYGDLQMHITADVAYALHEYFRITGDLEFMMECGFEIMFETARFWAHFSKYNKAADRYEINDVMGPDEYHKHVDNNFYTNFMAKWNIQTALDYMDQYSGENGDIAQRLGIDSQEKELWQDVVQKLFIPVCSENGVIEQFEGYFNRQELIITQYDENHMPIRPAVIEDANDTQLLKQADVIMLMYLFGSKFDKASKQANYEYYLKRTLHESSLSPSIYAIMGIELSDYSSAYRCFMNSAFMDLHDNQNNTWNGIHSASTGGTWLVAMHGFAGVRIDGEGTLCINPWLPEHWVGMRFKLIRKGSVIDVNITRTGVELKLTEGESVTVKVNGDTVVVK